MTCGRGKTRCGLHTSVAGGLGKMLGRAKALGEDAAQIFVKSNRRWEMPLLDEEEAENFRVGKKAQNLWVCAHAGYLINVAGDSATRRKSIHALAEEIRRAEELDLEALVVHCGSRGERVPAEARRRAMEGFCEALDKSQTCRIRIALENSAGQGSSMARDLAEWGELVAGLPGKRRAACLDTAHAFAAGYDLRTEAGRKHLFGKIQKEIGIENLVVIHANDSKTECGSGVDRHEHLGRGKIGGPGLRAFLREAWGGGIPRIGELPPGEREDRENLDFLQSNRPTS
ncbi:MAG: deoxyribonuclease IV [Verrucomicrobia bacterium]|nr:deoxyribonuclease IV [Verrucomicrobiota bacterium]